MYAVTVSNNKESYFGIFDTTNRALAADEAIDSLCVYYRDEFRKYNISPIPDNQELKLSDVEGVLVKQGSTLQEAFDSEETFYVQVYWYRTGRILKLEDK